MNFYGQLFIQHLINKVKEFLMINVVQLEMNLLKLLKNGQVIHNIDVFILQKNLELEQLGNKH